jgi:hypothetical protein
MEPDHGRVCGNWPGRHAFASYLAGTMAVAIQK